MYNFLILVHTHEIISWHSFNTSKIGHRLEPHVEIFFFIIIIIIIFFFFEKELRNFIELELPNCLHYVVLQKVKDEELPPSILHYRKRKSNISLDYVLVYCHLFYNESIVILCINLKK